MFLSLIGSAGAAAPNDNQLTVVVAGGPFAGTYKASGAPIACARIKSRDLFGAGWKDFNAKGNELAEVGIEVSNPDGSAPKHGNVHVGFGGGDKMTVYKIFTKPVSLQSQGRGGVIEFDGKTDDGIRLHVEAICKYVEEF